MMDADKMMERIDDSPAYGFRGTFEGKVFDKIADKYGYGLLALSAAYNFGRLSARKAGEGGSQ